MSVQTYQSYQVSFSAAKTAINIVVKFIFFKKRQQCCFMKKYKLSAINRFNFPVLMSASKCVYHVRRCSHSHLSAVVCAILILSQEITFTVVLPGIVKCIFTAYQQQQQEPTQQQQRQP